MTSLSAPAPRLATSSGVRPVAGRLGLRVKAFLALGLYGATHWARIVRPSAQGDLLLMLVIALAAGLLSRALLSRPAGAPRVAGLVALGFVTFGLLLLATGVPLWILRPDHWDELVGHLGDALTALPALRMPYRGFDDWVRAVLELGGGLLLAAAAVLLLAPRARTFGAAVCLGTLYATAIIEHTPTHPYLDGAVFALLLGFVLWGDRLDERERPLAIGFGLLVVLAAVILAPRLDSGRPWIDYEKIAESLQGGKSDTFVWNHHYGPITWSRDGLELARSQTKGDLYLKTANLEDFDGREWIQDRSGFANDDDSQDLAGRHPEWQQTIHVSIKGLKSRQFLGAGSTLRIFNASRQPVEVTPDVFNSATKPLKRGDGYDATVYYPRPSTAQMNEAGAGYSYAVVRGDLGLEIPARGPGATPLRVAFAPWQSGRGTFARRATGFEPVDADAALRSSPYARTYALAQLLASGAQSPYDYVRKVIARVQRDARYSETPPAPKRGVEPLEAFLFDDHAGYCQYFAGATALLLRMGGVPARVVAGFAPGSRDGKDHVVRDLDAHSWVEVYFPDIGWVTFDPTPGDSPARSQITDRIERSSSITSAIPNLGAVGERTAGPTPEAPASTAAAAESDSTPWVVAGAVVLAVLLAWAAVWIARRRQLARSEDPEVEELRLALIRTGRPAADSLTLHRLEYLLGSNPGALGYLEALRLARYGRGAAPPTPHQRRALRQALGAGLGLRVRLLALWALPPRPREVLDALRPRRRRPYTG